MKNLFAIFILFSIISSCNWSNAPLGGDYYYLDTDEAMDIGFPDGAIIYKSQNRNVFSEILIPGDVVEVVFDDRYIIAEQMPREFEGNFRPTYFYLIHKPDGSIYGPCSSDSLAKLKRSFKIELEL